MYRMMAGENGILTALLDACNSTGVVRLKRASVYPASRGGGEFQKAKVELGSPEY